MTPELTMTPPGRRQFGSVFALANGKYEARYRLAGRAYKKTFRTQPLAERHLAKTQAELDAGTYVAPVTRRFMFAEAERLLTGDYAMRGLRSLDRVQDALNHLRPHFGARPLAAIGADRLTEYVVARQAEAAANSTIHKELSALRRMFRLAVVARKLNPAQVPTFPKLEIDNVREGFVSVGEFNTLLAELTRRDPAVAELVQFLYVSGWRRREAQFLPWSAVDWDSGAITLAAARSKNKKPRLFPFAAHPTLKALLECRRAATEQAQRQAGSVISWVFFRGPGRVIKDFGDTWAQATHAAGLPGLLVHDLRRSAARNLIRSGVSQQVAQQFTGHVTPTIFSRYNITDTRDLEDAAQKLAAFAAAHPTAPRKVVALG